MSTDSWIIQESVLILFKRNYLAQSDTFAVVGDLQSPTMELWICNPQQAVWQFIGLQILMSGTGRFGNPPERRNRFTWLM